MNQQSAVARDIRVLLVDDSLLTIEFIRRMLAAAPEIQVVGIGQQRLGIEPMFQVRPDLVIIDLHMPKWMASFTWW